MMEVLKGNMTQKEYSLIRAEITRLELEQQIGIDNKKRLNELYELIGLEDQA